MSKTLIPAGKVFAVGESLLDLISKGNFLLKIVPGGSMLNTCVSLGRLGVDTHLISEFGGDKAGEIIEKFLHANGVQTEYCIKYSNNKTALALAFLDEYKNATYSFYTDFPKELAAFQLPDFSSTDFLLYGSSYAVKPERQDLVGTIVKQANESGAFIFYDPNFRKNHAHANPDYQSVIAQNMKSATLIKGSEEDFMYLFGISDPVDVYNQIRQTCGCLVVTSGSASVNLFTPQIKKKYAVPEIIPVSTIGAGDNFSAGLIYGLLCNGINRKNISNVTVKMWDEMIGRAINFASSVCLSSGNYISKAFVRLNK